MGILSLDGVFTRKHHISPPGHHRAHETYDRQQEATTSHFWARDSRVHEI